MTRTAPISGSAALELINSGALLIDVRSDAGRAADGTIAGATIVAKSGLDEFSASTPIDQEIVVFCGSIDGSGPVVDWLVQHDYSRVHHVDGGFDALKGAGALVTP